MSEHRPPPSRLAHCIAPGVYGWLERPQPHELVQDCLIISGWAFGENATITELRATGFGEPEALQYGLKRDDLARAYPGIVDAAESGFSGYVEIERTSNGPVRLEVWARFSDGRSLRLFDMRLRVGLPAADGAVRTRARRAVTHGIQRVQALVAAARRLKRLVLMPSGQPGEPAEMPSARKVAEDAAKVALRNFLTTGAELRMPGTDAPLVSVVIVVWNRAALTFRCLRALAEQTEVPIEVIIVDNNSTDDTQELLRRVRSVTIRTHAMNLGFTLGANLGAQAARGEFLLFLNNDAEVMPGCLVRLVETMRQADSIGAAGGKLVHPDGRLQEAGSIIWSDGSCEGYGRGENPSASEFTFQRDVDFCSGALLLTRQKVFEAQGGFDERYRPAYYEDADCCVRLWKRGYRVVYQPAAVAIHLEFGSAPSSEQGISLQVERRGIFVEQHRHWLSGQASRDRGLLAARAHPHGRPAALIIDDELPNPNLGAGFPRAAALLCGMMELGYAITLHATGQDDRWRARGDAFPEVEKVHGGIENLGAFLRSGRRFNLVVVSRPHNMRYLKAAIGSDLAVLHAPVVYDAEAIYALREVGRRALSGRPLSEEDARSLVDQEIGLARGCAAVVSVTGLEQRRFMEGGVSRVFVLGHAAEALPTPRSFESRRGILFVGAFGTDSPNEDAALFLVNEILPALKATSLEDVPVFVAGAHLPERLRTLVVPNVSWHADVDDLTSLYDAARVFVAPTRYAAGLPIKLIEAAAHGIPIVCTPLLARQLGWEHGSELLTAETPRDFARAIECVHTNPDQWEQLRQSALDRVAREHGPKVFRETLRTILRVDAQGPVVPAPPHD